MTIYEGDTLEKAIVLYREEITEIRKAQEALERYDPKYPTIRQMRETINHYTRLVKWLEELEKLRKEKRLSK